MTKVMLDPVTFSSLNVESRLLLLFFFNAANLYILKSYNPVFPSSGYLSKSIFKSSPISCLLDLHTSLPQEFLQLFCAQNLMYQLKSSKYISQ